MTAPARDLHRACEILTAVNPTGACWFDHSGHCEAHDVGEVDGRCAVAALREFLDEMRPGWSL